MIFLNLFSRYNSRHLNDISAKNKDFVRTKDTKGITLVALVVTIIVLLILAGVTIMTLFGENGLISMAQRAKSETENAQANSLTGIGSLMNEMNSILNGTGDTGDTGGTDTTPPIEVDVDGLGKVEIKVPGEENNPTPEITYDPDTGDVGGVVPPAAEPETPAEIPEEKLPELIEFTYGKIETNTTYTPGTTQTVPYKETLTVPKYPVTYQNSIWSQWNVAKDVDGNITKVVPLDIALADIDEKYSTYILYDFTTNKYLEMEGVHGDSVELWTIYNGSDDTLDNIIYLAAYLKKTDGNTNRHVAKWDGSKYVAVDYDAEINAVNTFVGTITMSGTKEVEITAPSTSTNSVYVPIGTLKAEKGMTWNEWLTSDYNTIGLTCVAVMVGGNEIVATTNDSLALADGDGKVLLSNVEAGFFLPGKPGYWDGASGQTYIHEEIIPGNNYVLANYMSHIGASFGDEWKELTWSELKLAENGEKYGYDSSKIANTSIGDSAFENCESLTNINISNRITNIGEGAFRNCTSLGYVCIGYNITTIGDSVFAGCISLTEINYSGTQAEWNSITKGRDWHDSVPDECVVHCSDGDIAIADAG